MYEAILDSPLEGITEKSIVPKDYMNNWIHTDTCAVCGKEFSFKCDRKEYAYKISGVNRHGVTRLACSWKCKRAWEQRKEEERRARKNGQVDWRTNVEAAKKRLKRCEEKIDFYKKREAESKTFHEREASRKNVLWWNEQLKQVQAVLKMREAS